ncbi:MAG: DUF2288 domain-containing protein [Gammaproteobacteria bacterium]|jgi:hypothetical protein
MTTGKDNNTGAGSNADSDLLFQKLNLETGQINWLELQRYFARGIVIIVAKDLDLVEAARQFSCNNKETVQGWLDQGRIKHATDDDARQWHDKQQDFWAVVAAPWVLVQTV